MARCAFIFSFTRSEWLPKQDNTKDIALLSLSMLSKLTNLPHSETDEKWGGKRVKVGNGMRQKKKAATDYTLHVCI